MSFATLRFCESHFVFSLSYYQKTEQFVVVKSYLNSLANPAAVGVLINFRRKRIMNFMRFYI
jgi:hypothetical protein